MHEIFAVSGVNLSKDTILRLCLKVRVRSRGEEIKRKCVSTRERAILNEGGIYGSDKSRERNQAVLSKEASTASGTEMRTNKSLG